jgi:hypothetical protein
MTRSTFLGGDRGHVILRGFKNPSTDLWTLPITPKQMRTAQPQSAPISDCDLHPNNTLHNGVDLASFTHSVCTQDNGIKFAHQVLCNPLILILLKAVHKGYLKGCPNISKKLISKYLNPSATAKGHMKHPCHGIRSTMPKRIVPLEVEHDVPTPNIPLVPAVSIIPLIIDLPCINKAQCAQAPNVILDDSD